MKWPRPRYPGQNLCSEIFPAESAQAIEAVEHWRIVGEAPGPISVSAQDEQSTIDEVVGEIPEWPTDANETASET